MPETIQVLSTKGRSAILADAEMWFQPHSCEFRDGYIFVARPADVEWGTCRAGKGQNKLVYACKQIRCGGKVRTVMLHRLLMDASAKEFVDHRSRDGLDNRRRNLRECSHTENMRNRRPNSGRRFKGVYKVRKSKTRWYAEIKANGQRFYLGSHATAELAAAAHDEAARKHHGEFASLNFN